MDLNHLDDYKKYIKYKTIYGNLKKIINIYGGNLIDINKKLDENKFFTVRNSHVIINQAIYELHQSLNALSNDLCCCHANIIGQINTYLNNSESTVIKYIADELQTYNEFLKQEITKFNENKINLSIEHIRQRYRRSHITISNITNKESIKSNIDKLTKIYVPLISAILAEYYSVIDKIFAHIMRAKKSHNLTFEKKISSTCIDDIKCIFIDSCKAGTSSCYNASTVTYNMPDCYFASYLQQIIKLRDNLNALDVEFMRYKNDNVIFQTNLLKKSDLSTFIVQFDELKKRIDEYENSLLNTPLIDKDKSNEFPKTVKSTKKTSFCQIL